LYSPPNISVIKRRKIKWQRHVPLIGNAKKQKRVYWEYPQGRDNQVAYTLHQKQMGYKDVNGLLCSLHCSNPYGTLKRGRFLDHLL
jgi:hypothetical protein